MLNQEIFQVLEMKLGPFDVDLFTARYNKQLKRFSRPRSGSCRCTSPAMDEHQTICISLVHSPRNMLAEELARGSPEDSDNCTGLAMTTLVSSLNREPDRPSNTATANPQSPHQSSRGPTPLGSEELTLPGHINSGVQSRTREFQERLPSHMLLMEKRYRESLSKIYRTHNRISDNEIEGRHAILHNEFL